ncbi:MAG: helix-turn-helix protein [Nitrospirae bacterium]|jgi:transcriptional regulator with XRE-family HTH domain|nr:helix-turn-helix protein [Nitrospirota bacterium]
MTFGEELRKIMKAQGVKAMTLAQRMGVSCAYVSQLLTGIRRPGRETLLKLSKALEVPPESLLMIESDIPATTKIPRKIPIVDETKIQEWSDWIDLAYPKLIADAYEYAATDDPYAFYITPKGLLSCCGLEMCDLILVEPSKDIMNGNSVLFRSPHGFSIRKYIIKDTMTILAGDKEDPIIFTGKNKEELKSYKVSLCLKKL